MYIILQLILFNVYMENIMYRQGAHNAAEKNIYSVGLVVSRTSAHVEYLYIHYFVLIANIGICKYLYK